MLRKEDRAPQWHVIDAADMVLGRLCTEVADKLRGKDKAIFTPQTDTGDYVVVINCDKIKLTGNKWRNKEYAHYTGWRSGRKTYTAKELFAKNPCELIYRSVKGMLPKNRLSSAQIKKLKTYVGTDHPHQAQVQK